MEKFKSKMYDNIFNILTKTTSKDELLKSLRIIKTYKFDSINISDNKENENSNNKSNNSKNNENNTNNKDIFKSPDNNNPNHKQIIYSTELMDTSDKTNKTDSISDSIIKNILVL